VATRPHLGALVIYRLGIYIRAPGRDPDIMEQIFRQQSGGTLGTFNMLAGSSERACRYATTPSRETDPRPYRAFRIARPTALAQSLAAHPQRTQT
jgi:hypothetical protein